MLVDDFAVEIADDSLDVGNGRDDGIVEQSPIDVGKLGGEWSVERKELLLCVEIELGVVASQGLHSSDDTFLLHEGALCFCHFGSFADAMADKVARCPHVVVGQMRVCAFQPERLEQRFELVGLLCRFEQPDELTSGR